MDLQCFAVVALAVADFAGHIDIRQEIHLDLDQPSPEQASQRPPLTLNEKRPGLYPRALASGIDAKSSRIGVNSPV